MVSQIGKIVFAVAFTYATAHDTTQSLAPKGMDNYNCLCLYDDARTLTAAQELECEGTTIVPGIRDYAYSGGTLKLSQLATHMNETFCVKCHHGIITRGDAGGDHSKYRDYMLANVVGPPGPYTLTSSWERWHYDQPSTTVNSSLIFFALDGKKQEAAKAIVKWFGSQGSLIPYENVHFFDDRQDNVQGFEGTGMNAIQVACAARDPTPSRSNIGKCGAVASEVVDTKGIKLCGSRHQEDVAIVV